MNKYLVLALILIPTLIGCLGSVALLNLQANTWHRAVLSPPGKAIKVIAIRQGDYPGRGTLYIRTQEDREYYCTVYEEDIWPQPPKCNLAYAPQDEAQAGPPCPPADWTPPPAPGRVVDSRVLCTWGVETQDFVQMIILDDGSVWEWAKHYEPMQVFAPIMLMVIGAVIGAALGAVILAVTYSIQYVRGATRKLSQGRQHNQAKE